MKGRKKRKGVDLSEFGWAPTYLTEGVYAATFALVVCLFAGAGLIDRYIKETGPSYVAAVIAATLVELTNTDRADAMAGELRVNPTLVAAAQAKADDMAHKGYFAHKTPEGYDSWHWFKEVGYDYTHAGENLAVDFSESADVERAWMASPTHRSNILNENYTEIGIAVAYGTYKGKPATFAVQMFARPSAGELREREADAAVAVEEPSPMITPSSDGATLGEATEEVEDARRIDPIREPQAASNGARALVTNAAEIPWWAYLAAEPSKTFRYAYYVIGLLILAALFFDMELELKWHHFRHARKAGILLATMSMLFIAADWLFFAEPTLAVIGAVLQ